MKILNSGKNLAEVNMAIDEKLLNELTDDPVLHFYEFDKGATFGYFMKPELFLREGHGLDLARRPTGGGMLFHLWDLTFSLLIPKDHEGYSDDVMKNYKYVNDRVLEALSKFIKGEADLLPEEVEGVDHFCFAKPTKYDVMVQGKKVAGAAQRKKKNGYLHQGSISVVMPDFEYLDRVFLEGDRIVQAMKKYTYVLTDGELEEARNEIRISLQKVFS